MNKEQKVWINNFGKGKWARWLTCNQTAVPGERRSCSQRGSSCIWNKRRTHCAQASHLYSLSRTNQTAFHCFRAVPERFPSGSRAVLGQFVSGFTTQTSDWFGDVELHSSCLTLIAYSGVALKPEGVGYRAVPERFQSRLGAAFNGFSNQNVRRTNGIIFHFMLLNPDSIFHWHFATVSVPVDLAVSHRVLQTHEAT